MSRIALALLASGVVAMPLQAQNGAKKAATAKPTKVAASPAKPAQKLAPAIGFVRFSGSYADLPEAGADLATMLMGGGGGKPKSFYGLADQLEGLTEESSVEKILFDLTGSVGFNNAQMAELERAFRKVRKSGKKLFAYLENAGSGHMQLAAMCHHVILADMGGIEIPSASLNVTFMRDALDLLGVKMDVVRCGDFKGAVEPYVLSSMSDHLRSHYVAMLSKMNGDVVRRIATGRHMASAEVRRLQVQRVLTARQALEAGLVDELVPWVGAKKAFARVNGKDKVRFRSLLGKKTKRKSVNFFTLMTNLLNPKAAEEDVEKGLVVLHLSGAIVDGSKRVAGSIVSGPTVDQIRKLTKDGNVQGVVVRINSPGGSATASEAILLALKDLAAKKPVVFSMGRVAASGGYYVTCIGRPILAEAGTITGSIGVFGMKPSLGALMRRVGVHEEIVGLDGGADFMAMGKSWTDEQKAVIQTHINAVYDRFTGHVSSSRGIPVADVLKIAGGRVWSGEQALANKLVDKVGGLEDALAIVAKEASVGDDYEVTHLPEPADMFASLVSDMMGAKALLKDPLLRLVGKQLGGLEPALRVLVDALTSKRPTRAWVLMPEGLVIR